MKPHPSIALMQTMLLAQAAGGIDPWSFRGRLSPDRQRRTPERVACPQCKVTAGVACIGRLGAHPWHMARVRAAEKA